MKEPTTIKCVFRLFLLFLSLLIRIWGVLLCVPILLLLCCFFLSCDFRFRFLQLRIEIAMGSPLMMLRGRGGRRRRSFMTLRSIMTAFTKKQETYITIGLLNVSLLLSMPFCIAPCYSYLLLFDSSSSPSTPVSLLFRFCFPSSSFLVSLFPRSLLIFSCVFVIWLTDWKTEAE